MKILVTGGAGFIGTYLIPSLVERGAEVVALDLSAAPAALAPVMDRITYVRADLGQSDDIYRAMLRYRPDQVVHLVSLLAGPCEANPPQAFRVNFNSTLTLLEAGAIIGLKRLVMTSSISVFGRGCREPVQDDALKEPSNIYGQTKLACEHLLRFYAQHKGVEGESPAVHMGVLTCPPKTGPDFVREIWHNLKPKSGGGYGSEAVHHREDYRDAAGI